MTQALRHPWRRASCRPGATAANSMYTLAAIPARGRIVSDCSALHARAFGQAAGAYTSSSHGSPRRRSGRPTRGCALEVKGDRRPRVSGLAKRICSERLCHILVPVMLVCGRELRLTQRKTLCEMPHPSGPDVHVRPLASLAVVLSDFF